MRCKSESVLPSQYDGRTEFVKVVINTGIYSMEYQELQVSCSGFGRRREKEQQRKCLLYRNTCQVGLQ